MFRTLVLVALLFVSNWAGAQPGKYAFDAEVHAALIQHLEKTLQEDIAKGVSEDNEDVRTMKEYVAYLKEAATWPHTVDEAIEQIKAVNSAEEIATFVALSDQELIELNTSMGMGIRNSMGLWKGNPWLTRALCPDDCEPETASLVLIRIAQERLRLHD